MKMFFKKLNNKSIKDLKSYLENCNLKSIFKVDDLYEYQEESLNIVGMIIKDNQLKCFCIYEYFSRYKIQEDFEREQEFYEDDEIELGYEYINDIEENGIYINYIESFESGYGKIMVDALKNNYPKIILYSLGESRDFWEKSEFASPFGYSYIYPKKIIKEICNENFLNSKYSEKEILNMTWIQGVKF